MLVSLAQEMLRYRRVEGQEQPPGMEMNPFLLTSRWVSLERFVTSRLTMDKDCREATSSSNLGPYSSMYS
ncbi:hypothetical protein KUCAC02_009693 [Chaenocephalus aceratus]|nr:hypothetical protein KUCAC02_009693 [Chaenocephalus aceratus]